MIVLMFLLPIVAFWCGCKILKLLKQNEQRDEAEKPKSLKPLQYFCAIDSEYDTDLWYDTEKEARQEHPNETIKTFSVHVVNYSSRKERRNKLK